MYTTNGAYATYVSKLQEYSSRSRRRYAYLLTYLRTHPVIIGEDDVDVDDRSSLVRCQDVPFAVRGAVGDRSVFLALFTTNKTFKPKKGKTYRVRVRVGVVLRRGNVSTGERRTYIPSGGRRERHLDGSG